ncbi:venom acid phosphatase Acph-1-like [Venturia canescens]|uniref:venom acid phosphatase Acph-1-like n=1 Tax=Venturia canescens TaxID=32260 RepID=UPI001C9CE8C6|nr:venom acid phosphatase Acph-1-like [Venturia canescens]
MFLQKALLLAILVSVKCDLRLKLLHVIFRHGDKIPHREYQNYPNDPHRNHSYYPIDNGGLTNEGMMREYEIGTMLRERYDEYFGAVYRPSMVYARSTELPRTQMSLQLVLAGLFPPSHTQMWNYRLPWVPTSTFFLPVEQDYLLFPHRCPRYIEEYRNHLKDSNVQEIINKYKRTMEYLTYHTGKRIETTSAVYYLYNLFKEEAAQNLTLPEWSHVVYPYPMKEILALDFYLRSSTKSLKRLNGGMLLRKITEDIVDLGNDALKPRERKAFFFSAHEVNVAALARALGTDDPIIPAYGSTIIFETLQDNANRYYVKVMLWTGVTRKLIVQKIPGCTEVCAFEEFLEITKDIIPNDKEYGCSDSEEQRAIFSSSDSINFSYFYRYWQLNFAFTIALVIDSLNLYYLHHLEWESD